MSNYAKCEEILYYICQGQTPGKKKVQKLLYLMERKGIDLGLNYSIHFYGPYSTSLDDNLHAMEAEGIIDIRVDHLTHRITLANETICPEILNDIEKNTMFEVLDNFGQKTAADLEAYTTLDYVAHTMLKENGTEDQVIQGVLKIKSKKFSYDDLQEDYRLMKQLKYIS